MGVALFCVDKNTENYYKLMVVLQENIIIRRFIYYFLFIYLSGDRSSTVVKVAVSIPDGVIGIFH